MARWFPVLVLSCTPLAQSAEITGFVKDSSEAVIVGATITALSEETGVRREAASDPLGRYTIPFLGPGQYRVTARTLGFNPASRAGIRLISGQVARIDFALRVPALETAVTVTGTRPLLQTSSGALGAFLDRGLMGDLPLNGRSLQPILELIPGAVLTKTTPLEQGQFSVNGQRANANSFTIDGASANVGVFVADSLGQAGGGSLPGLSTSGGTNALFSMDALEEIHIQSSSYGAELGRTPGAQVSLTTRSGSNDWHGTLFEYFRNDALDATDWFAKSKGLPKPALRQNQFGATLGGPIAKDKTFFFLSYEGVRLRQPQTALTEVPWLSARLAAPETLQPFLFAFPIANGPRTARTVLSEFSATYSNPSELDVASLRLDHVLGPGATLFARYSRAPSETVQRGGGDSLNTVKTTSFTVQTLTAGATLALGSNVTNVVRANWSQNHGLSSNALDEFGGAEVPDPQVFAVSPQQALYSFRVGGNGITAGFLLGRGPEQIQRQLQFLDNLTVVSGRHQMLFGVDYRRLSPIFNPYVYGEAVQFSSTLEEVPGGIYSAMPVAIRVTANSGARSANFLSLSAFAQDVWSASPRLSLAYGLRWEFAPAPTTAPGEEPLALGGPVGQGVYLAPHGAPLWETTFRNFAPRVSVAYRLSRAERRETVLKGAVGIFYDLGQSAAGSAYAVGLAPFSEVSGTSGVYPLWPGFAPRFLDNLRRGQSFTRLAVAFDPKLQLPYTMEWNLTAEQAMGRNQSLMVSYVGALGRRLLMEEYRNLYNPDARLSVVDLFTNAGSSSYHALQVQFHRRVSRGLQGLASYTWSHSIDTASDESLTLGTVNHSFIASLNRGPSDFDVRHSGSAAISYEIPTPHGPLGPALAHLSIDAIFRARSATPVNIVNFSNLRLVPGQPLYVSDPTSAGGRRINGAAFASTTDFRNGTLGRNALRGFAAWQVDLALRRSFQLGRGLRLQLSAEAFNLFNHPNFGNPEGSLTSSFFGQSTSMLGSSLGSAGRSGGFSPIYQIGGPRSVQLALKMQF